MIQSEGINVDDLKEVMTIGQAAEFMQIHYNTMWRLIKEKRVPAKKIGRQWRILRKDLMEYMNSHDE